MARLPLPDACTEWQTVIVEERGRLQSPVGTSSLSIPSKETLKGKPHSAASIEPGKSGKRQTRDLGEQACVILPLLPAY